MTEVVRWQVEPLERPHRGLEDRIVLAAPWVGRRLARRAATEPPGSRRRRAVFTRGVQIGVAASNRGDYEVMMANYHPDIELISPGRGKTGIGFDEAYRGHDGVRRFTEQWKSGFASHTYEPREIADPGGDRFAFRLGMLGTMRGSQAEVETEAGAVNTIEDGLVVRQVNYFDWEEALAALTE